MRARTFPLFVSMLTFLAAGCKHAVPPPAPTALNVEFAGCQATLVPGPVCVLSEKRRLTLWVPSPPRTRIEIRVGDRVLAPVGDPVGEGRRFELTIPPNEDRVEVSNEAPGSRSGWSLALSGSRALRRGERDVQAEIDHRTKSLYRVIQNLQLTDARAILDNLSALASTTGRDSLVDLTSIPTPLPAESRYLLAYYRCLLAAKEGDYRAALIDIASAIEIADHAKRRRALWFAEEKHALLLSELGRSREAAAAFARLASAPPSSSARSQGELLTNQAWAMLLEREAGGKPDASLESPVPLLERAIAKFLSDPDCPSKPNCPYREVFSSRLNLVLAHLQEGRPDLSAMALAAARATQTEATLFDQLWELDLAARVDLARGRPRPALATYERLNRIAKASGSPDGRLRAALGRARATVALGDREEALDVLRMAEDLLDSQSLQVPLNEGRETFVSQRQGIGSLEVELLLDIGRTEQAFEAARRARSRVLRQLALGERLASLPPKDRKQWTEAIEIYQRERLALAAAASDDWRLSAKDLGPARAERALRAAELARSLDRAFALVGSPPAGIPLAAPRAGELLLAFHPLPSSWVAFAADEKGIAVHPFSLDDALLENPEALAREVLEPFHAEIDRARRLRILPYGPLRSVDFHALPFAGDVLLKAKPVVYGLDIPVKSVAATQVRPGESRALLVADPNGNLPGALAEVDEVIRAITAWKPSWRIARLTAAAAGAEPVRGELLSGLKLFHFSGHGTFGGFEGWDSRLRLAGDSGLTIGDLLPLDRAPRWVVLSGCETGRSGAEARIEGLGIANAFVLAGSRAVVASVRPVDDKTTPLLFADLYRRWDGESDLAVALQAAQLAWRHRDRNADWASFRIVEP